MKEKWKFIKKSKKLYMASNFGKIKSFAKGKEIIIKGNLNKKNGYWMTCVNGKKRETHRWIAETWIKKNKKGYLEVNHINGNKLDNRVENLEWVTKKQNIQHALKKGKMDNHIKNMSLKNKGSNNPKAKLNDEKVLQIREYQLKNKNLNFTEIAKIFNVSRQTISLIVKRKSWKHI